MPLVDDGGYDLVLEANGVVRHVQMKASFRGTERNACSACRDHKPARGNRKGIAPRLPDRTLLHEIAHIVLGHTAESLEQDGPQTPRSLREVEAEGTALLCASALNLGGVEYSRGYIQTWLRGESIPERSCQRIFKAADLILRAGRESLEGEE